MVKKWSGNRRESCAFIIFDYPIIHLRFRFSNPYELRIWNCMIPDGWNLLTFQGYDSNVFAITFRTIHDNERLIVMIVKPRSCHPKRVIERWLFSRKILRWICLSPEAYTVDYYKLNIKQARVLKLSSEQNMSMSHHNISWRTSSTRPFKHLLLELFDQQEQKDSYSIYPLTPTNTSCSGQSYLCVSTAWPSA